MWESDMYDMHVGVIGCIQIRWWSYVNLTKRWDVSEKVKLHQSWCMNEKSIIISLCPLFLYASQQIILTPA